MVVFGRRVFCRQVLNGSLVLGASLAAPPETGQLLLGFNINRRDELCGGTELIIQPANNKREG